MTWTWPDDLPRQPVEPIDRKLINELWLAVAEHRNRTWDYKGWMRAKQVPENLVKRPYHQDGKEYR